MSQTMSISMEPFKQAGTLLCSQYDVGRTITVNLVDNSGDYTIPSGATVKIEATKPSGYGFSESCTWSGSTVTITLTSTMTEEGGRFPAELVVTSGNTVLGSANFLMRVEGSPHLENVVDGDAETAQALTLRVTALETQVATNTSDISDLDTRVTTLESSSSGSGLTSAIKTALLNCFANVAWTTSSGQTYYDALETALGVDYSVTYSLTHVTSSNTATTISSGSRYTTTLTASSNYTLNTVSVTMGGSDITSTVYSSGTISIGSVTGDIVITATAVLAAESITATYTQSGTVYTTASLSDLTSDLVVVATYADSSTATLTSSDYTLSGTLTEGTCTITVTYAGLTDTFTVTVSEAPTDTTVQLDSDHMDYGQSSTFGTYSVKSGLCPSIQYAITTTATSTYDYLCGIIPVDAVGSTNGRAWFWLTDSTGSASSAYGSGKPINVKSDSMTEGSVSFGKDNGYQYVTIPIGYNYTSEAYLYVQSTGEVLFAGSDTPYYGMSNISEASS